MTASSTIIIKKPQSQERAAKWNKESDHSILSGMILVSLWVFSSLFAAAKADIISNASGLSISFTMQDVIVMALTSWILYKGLTTSHVILCAPWLILNTYSIYYGHYQSILRMMKLLGHVKYYSSIAWAAMCLSSLALVIRVVLVLRIVQLAAHIWYKAKLEREIYQTF